MVTCPSDASGFRFYAEYDLEKGTPVSGAATCPARIPGGSLLLKSARGLDPQGLSQPLGALVWVNPTLALSLPGLAWGRSPRQTKLVDERRKLETEDQMSLKGLGKGRSSSQLVLRNSDTPRSPRGEENCPGGAQVFPRLCQRFGSPEVACPPPAPTTELFHNPLWAALGEDRAGWRGGEVR